MEPLLCYGSMVQEVFSLRIGRRRNFRTFTIRESILICLYELLKFPKLEIENNFFQLTYMENLGAGYFTCCRHVKEENIEDMPILPALLVKKRK